MAQNKNIEFVPDHPSKVAMVNGYEDDADKGMEGVDQNDFSLGFLGILQTLSSAVEAGLFPKGYIMNSATSKAVDGELGIYFIPVFRERLFVEWVPREKGGGRVADYKPEDEVVLNAIENADEQYKLFVNENHLIETFYMYGIVIGEEIITQEDVDYALEQNGEVLVVGTKNEICFEACIPFTSAKIKRYKGWMTELRALKFTRKDNTKANYPLFAHKFQLKTVEQEAPGGKYYNWDINFAGSNAATSRLSPHSEYYKMAKKLHEYLTKDGLRDFKNEKTSQEGDTDPEVM